MKDYEELCLEATTAARVIRGKWRIHIFCALQAGPVRLGQLARIIPEASKKVIAQNLKQLEIEGVLIRRDLSAILLHVEYDFSEMARPEIAKLLHCLADLANKVVPFDG